MQHIQFFKKYIATTLCEIMIETKKSATSTDIISIQTADFRVPL